MREKPAGLHEINTGVLGGMLVLAPVMVMVICNEAINQAGSYLLRRRPREERKNEGELY